MTDATGEARKLRVFVSYAREDGDFVEELVASLQACGFEAYVDQKDIAPGEGFAKRIEGLIQSADTIVFALSPFSLDSEWCGREVDQTVALSKRMFPILLRDVDRSKEPERLAALQEIDFSKPKSFGKGLRLLVEALNADLDWVREHTRLGDLALRWKHKGAGTADLLHGNAIDEAEAWLARAPKSAAAPTADQREYIAASRKSERASAEHERQQIEDIKAAQAHTQRMQTRFKYVLWGIGALVALAAVGTAWFASYATRLVQQTLLQNARVATLDGRHLQAMRLALSGLPGPGSWNPLHRWSAELEAELASAAAASRHLMTLGAPSSRELAPTGVHFLPDGRRLVTVTYDGKVKLWDSASGKLVRTINAHKDAIYFTALSADGARLISATETEAAIHNLERPAESKPITMQGLIRAVAFSGQDPLALTVSTDQKPAVFNLTGNKIVSSSNGVNARITAAAFSGDGHSVAVGDVSGKVVAWTVASGAPIADYKEHTGEVVTLAFDRKALNILSTSFDTSGTVWNVADKKAITLDGHSQVMIWGAFHEEPDQVITAGADRSARVWTLSEGAAKSETPMPHPAPVVFADFLDDGRIVTVGQDGILRFWDGNFEQEARFAGHRGRIIATAIDRKGDRMATASLDGTVILWDTRYEGRDVDTQGDAVLALLGSGDERVFTMDDDGIMRIGNAADNEEVVALGRLAENVGRFAAFSPDGTRIALPDGKRRIRIADTTNGQTALTIQLPEAQSGASATDTTEIAALMYAPNGQSLAVADAEGAISVWKAATGERLAGPEIPPQGKTGPRILAAPAVAAGASGPLLAFVEQDNRQTISIWRRGSSTIEALQPLDVDVLNLALSPDGRRLAIATSNGLLRLIDLATERTLMQISSRDQYFRSIAFSADGRYLTAIEANHQVRIVEVYWAAVPMQQELTAEVCAKKLRNASEFHSDERAGIWRTSRSAVCQQYR